MTLSARHPADARTVAPLAAGILACAILVVGCIIIPVDYHASGSRHNVATSSTNVLQIGYTTREEVLLTLGEPDFVSEDHQRFGYRWSKVKAIWAVASYGSGAAGEVIRSYLIETSFDQSNRVSGLRLKMQWGEAVSGTPDTNTLSGITHPAE